MANKWVTSCKLNLFYRNIPSLAEVRHFVGTLSAIEDVAQSRQTRSFSFSREHIDMETCGFQDSRSNAIPRPVPRHQAKYSGGKSFLTGSHPMTLYFSLDIGTIHDGNDNSRSADPIWRKFSHYGIIRRQQFGIGWNSNSTRSMTLVCVTPVSILEAIPNSST